MHLPGHNFLGPGSDLNSGNHPIDEDDLIAYGHDLQYQKAKSSQDIRSADRQAIGKFASDFYETGNYHSAIGAFGLGIKYAGKTLITNQIELFCNRVLHR